MKINNPKNSSKNDMPISWAPITVKVSFVGIITGIVTSFMDLFQSSVPKNIILGALVVFVIVFVKGAYECRHELRTALRCGYFKIYNVLHYFNPWVAAITLLVSVVIMCLSFIGYFNNHMILIEDEGGNLFNSAKDDLIHPAYIHIIGDPKHELSWGKSSEGIYFNFEINSKLMPADDIANTASSGGYLRFYNTAIDLRFLKKLVFSMKVDKFDKSSSAITCNPDVGLRVVLDDPEKPEGPDRQMIVREIKSVRQQYGIPDSAVKPWNIEADIRDFQRVPSNYDIPEKLNSYSVNKVVFFITPAMLKSCSKARYIFRDIGFMLK